jgi:hypothetical protein
MKTLLPLFLAITSLPVLTHAAATDEAAQAKAVAAGVVAEFAKYCPTKPVGDRAAFEVCRLGLFNNPVLKNSLKNFVLWGRAPGQNINASLKDFRATQFGHEVFTGGYAPMWMVSDSFEFEYLPQEKTYRALVSAGFRNELDFGSYPYPFWHDAKKWTDYEDANTLILWIDPKIMKVTQLTFVKRADKPVLAQTKRRHVPTFDGKWMWVDDKGLAQPAPTLFQGLYSEKNPNLVKLDETYRKFALTMRDAECLACHVPNNPDHMRRLVLLQTPLHAASEIERVIKDVKHDRMPLDESGLEKPLDDAKKQQLLADAETFAKAVREAREWETKNAKTVQK